MQAIMETLFDIVYLLLVITIGIRMMIKGRKERQYFWFGLMAVILGSGDAFHLLPRAYALCTTGLENFTAALGIGKLVTSITMTIFYVAGNCVELRILYSGSAFCRCGSHDRYAHDTKNLCLCVDSIDRIL